MVAPTTTKSSLMRRLSGRNSPPNNEQPQVAAYHQEVGDSIFAGHDEEIYALIDKHFIPGPSRHALPHHAGQHVSRLQQYRHRYRLSPPQKSDPLGNSCGNNTFTVSADHQSRSGICLAWRTTSSWCVCRQRRKTNLFRLSTGEFRFNIKHSVELPSGLTAKIKTWTMMVHTRRVSRPDCRIVVCRDKLIS